MRLFICPVLVGGGKPALPRDIRVELEPIDEQRFISGVVYLRCRARSDRRLPRPHQSRSPGPSATSAATLGDTGPAADTLAAVNVCRMRLAAGHPVLCARVWENNRPTEEAIVEALTSTGVLLLEARVAAGAVMGALTAALLDWAEDQGDETLDDRIVRILGVLGADELRSDTRQVGTLDFGREHASVALRRLPVSGFLRPYWRPSAMIGRE